MLDDRRADYERFETELVAQNRDAARLQSADLSSRGAKRLVTELIDAEIVVPVPENRLLVHQPSGEAFDSITQLAVSHRGWTAGRETGEKET